MTLHLSAEAFFNENNYVVCEGRLRFQDATYHTFYLSIETMQLLMM